MSNHKSLIFFNKEGDSLNFSYSDDVDRYEGDILFHQNSSDTYKTYGIYTMEKIDPFEFELPEELTLDKFQLFNEWGFHFYGSRGEISNITKIEPVNNDWNFYSKWIYGDNFEKKYPIGTLIVFESSFLEFTNNKKVYSVIGSKKNAIMILSTVDNSTFEKDYYSTYSSESIYSNVFIRGINCLGIYNYIDNNYGNNISDWSEPKFYEKFYPNKKLNVIGSEKNDGILTVKDNEVTDLIHFEYHCQKLPDNSNIIMEVLTRNDLPKIYDGEITINNGRIYFNDTFNFPKILKPGTEFKLVGSELNTNFLVVSDIPSFLGNTKATYYATQSQVIYDNKIYQCVYGYTQSFADESTKLITPNNSKQWSNPTYVSVRENVSYEKLYSCQVYLTTDKIKFEQEWTQSEDITLASFADKYKTDLESLNIDIFYEKGLLRADLMYPSKYAEVNFYHTNIGETYSITKVNRTYERLVEVKETLAYELNYNFSENYKYNIVFTDLDEYGIKLFIDGQVYEEEIAWVYSSGIVDMERTIDRTLRGWLTRNHIKLYTLGVISELAYIGNFTSPFFNSIVLKTEYPNVPLVINKIEVGLTAKYQIEHSRILFNGTQSIGPNLSITINNRRYDQESIYEEYNQNSKEKVVNVKSTLNEWVKSHGTILEEYGILTKNINNILKFDVLDSRKRIDYDIKIGKLLYPGQNTIINTKKIKGNLGVLISSNEVIIPKKSKHSFEEAGFSTGMIMSINNTNHPYNNTEFKIQYLNKSSLNLSYEGPFWGLTDSVCSSSSFVTLAFDLGFGATACYVPAIPGDGEGGPFNIDEYSDVMFSLNYKPTSISVNPISLGDLGVTDMTDIIYVQLSNYIYILGTALVVMDAHLYIYVKNIQLPNIINPIRMIFNSFNNYIYCLSEQIIYVIDPSIDELVKTINLSKLASDICSNSKNGDIYVTYKNSPTIDIYNSENSHIKEILAPNPITSTDKIVYNSFENDIYLTTDSDYVLRIDGEKRIIQTNYNLPGSKGSIFYEPVYESIFVAGDELWRIDNSAEQSISGVITSGFTDFIFNNLTGEICISNINSTFKSVNLLDNSIVNNNGINTYGYMTLNQMDSNIYLSSDSSNTILVIDSINGNVISRESIGSKATKSVYNPERGSVWAIQPNINSVVELLPKINSVITYESSPNDELIENMYGSLDPSYKKRDNIWLKTREYVRKPRENFNGDTQVEFYWKWMSDNVPEFFMYDLSGDQLEKEGTYAYIGPKPLNDVSMIKKPNKDISMTHLPEYQQTIFDKISYKLDYIDVDDITAFEPDPLELFIGFKSEDEGALRSVIQLYKKEPIEFDITSNEINNIIIKFETIDENGPDKRGKISLDIYSGVYFNDKGLKPGQNLALLIKDITNKNSQYLSTINGNIFIIREVNSKEIILDFFDKENDYISPEKTVISDYPVEGQKTYLKTTFKVVDREIARFNCYAQTEVEDIRFKTELGNIGKNIGSNEIFIFKDYDILEGGIDWKFLNMKRKELLLMKGLIFPYIGSYKSIINAINFFGYNDLQLNEYYRNIDVSSENFSKLFKVEIPDIFDNSVEGWTENDFTKNNFPNEKFEETNMFNLTYDITDKEGQNVLNYTLDEVTIKLQGLKYWLKKNIIPLTHKILDITGRSYFTGSNHITHTMYDIRIFDNKQDLTPISFKLNEAYLMPVNSGSTVYNCVLDFYSIIEGLGADKDPLGLKNIPKPLNSSKLIKPDYFDIKIRTYKTYKEWLPYVSYNKGDKVTYYDKVYISAIDNNKIKSPRRFEDVKSWEPNIVYEVATIVEWNREYYSYSGLGSSDKTVNPYLDNGDNKNWVNITEWKKIDLEPVQSITEYRNGDNLEPFNFTIDSNIDPFITIEVTSDNGYGAIFRDKKNYEIRGLKDLVQPIKYIEKIGPFQPISTVY